MLVASLRIMPDLSHPSTASMSFYTEIKHNIFQPASAAFSSTDNSTCFQKWNISTLSVAIWWGNWSTEGTATKRKHRPLQICIFYCKSLTRLHAVLMRSMLILLVWRLLLDASINCDRWSYDTIGVCTVAKQCVLGL